MTKYIIIGGSGWPKGSILQASLARGMTAKDLGELLKGLPAETKILIQVEGRLFGGTSGRVVTK